MRSQIDGSSGICRIIDANANRLKEGLRVCEEVSRFILEDERLTRELKCVRHEVDGLLNAVAGRTVRLAARDSVADTGRRLHTAREFKRAGVADLFAANIQRVKESIRVLEEFSKIRNKKCALAFKDLRYRVYAIEKEVCLSLRGVPHSGTTKQSL